MPTDEQRKKRKDAENRRRAARGQPPLGAWGGRRKAEDVKTTIKTTPAEPKAEDRRPFFSEASVEAILRAFEENRVASRNRPRTPEWNPYVIRPERFGPVHEHIKKHKPQLAMDKNKGLARDNQIAVEAWQAGGLLGNMVSEGLLFLGYPYLSELAQRPEFRLFGEIRAQEMTRKWIDYRPVTDESTKEEDAENEGKKQNNPDDEARAREKRMAGDEEPRTDARNKEIEDKIKELVDAMEEFRVRDWFQVCAGQDSYFGISHLLVDIKGTDVSNIRDPELPQSIGNGRNKISKNKLGKGCLRGFRAIEPIWAYPMAYNASNPLIESWYDPQQWYVMGTEIHKTRLLNFIGRPVPDILKPAYAFGGLSMTQMAQPYVQIWLKTRESVGALIHAFSVMCLGTNLGTTTMPGGAGGGQGDVLARMMMFLLMRDNQGLFVYDKATEDFKNVAAPLSGLDELQAQSQEHMASVARLPLVKFTGIQPKGLNATSEGEMRAFYDTISGEQNHLFRPNLTTVSDIIQIHLWGACDRDITFDFVELWEQTAKEKAEIRKIDAETAQILIDSGQISQEEARRRLATDPESGYHEIDPDDVPDLLEEEQEGLAPPGARGLEGIIGEGEPGAEPPAKPPGSKSVVPFAESRLRAASDEAKPTLDKDEVGYVDGWPKAATRCPRCSMYVRNDDEPDDSACTLVKGRIRLHGHCRRFQAARAAADEFRESEHPRVSGGEKGGQFTKGGGGGRAKQDPHAKRQQRLERNETIRQANKKRGEELENEPRDPMVSVRMNPMGPGSTPAFKSKKDHAEHLLKKGVTTKEMLDALGWPSISMPAMAKSLNMRLEKVKEGKITRYKGISLGPRERPEKTHSLLPFLARRGGIRADDGNISDVRTAIGKGNKFIPGFGQLIRPHKQISTAAKLGGKYAPMDLDQAREAAEEAGYIPAGTTLAEFIEAIDSELRGQHVYPEGYVPPGRSADPEEAEHEKAGFLEDLHKVGELSDAERARAVALWQHEGINDPVDILERIALETDDREISAGAPDREPVPGWDDDGSAVPF